MQIRADNTAGKYWECGPGGPTKNGRDGSEWRRSIEEEVVGEGGGARCNRQMCRAKAAREERTKDTNDARRSKEAEGRKEERGAQDVGGGQKKRKRACAGEGARIGAGGETSAAAWTA